MVPGSPRGSILAHPCVHLTAVGPDVELRLFGSGMADRQKSLESYLTPTLRNIRELLHKPVLRNRDAGASVRKADELVSHATHEMTYDVSRHLPFRAVVVLGLRFMAFEAIRRIEQALGHRGNIHRSSALTCAPIVATLVARFCVVFCSHA